MCVLQTAIICTVTPAAVEETHSTLRFASRAKTIKNKPQINEVGPGAWGSGWGAGWLSACWDVLSECFAEV